MEYVIEKNIPVPNSSGNSGARWAFIESLDNGDSFVVTIQERNYLYQYCRLKGIKTTTRICQDDKGKARVWVYPQK